MARDARPRWPGLRKSPLIQLALLSGLLLAASGCSGHSPAKLSSAQADLQIRKAARTQENVEREELEQIPPPSKSRYLGVRTKDAYGNPFLVIRPETVTLTVIFPDENTSTFGTGEMMRPVAARRHEIDIRIKDLPKALASLPPEVWPYGRVVGIEESPTAPPSTRVAIRRNVESTIQILNDLGIVVDEWTGSTGSLLR